MGAPDDAHGTAAHKALDELLTVLDRRLSQHPATNAWLQKAQARPAMQIDA